MHLVVLKSFNQLFTCLQHGDLCSGMRFVFKLHGGPGGIQLFQHLLHAHFLDGFVHDTTDIVLKVMEVQ